MGGLEITLKGWGKFGEAYRGLRSALPTSVCSLSPMGMGIGVEGEGWLSTQGTPVSARFPNNNHGAA